MIYSNKEYSVFGNMCKTTDGDNAACMPPNLPLMPPKHFRCLILLDWHKVIGRPQSDPVLQSFRNGAGSLQLGLWKPQAAAPADRWSETGATGQSYRERPFLRDPIANPMASFARQVRRKFVWGLTTDGSYHLFTCRW